MNHKKKNRSNVLSKEACENSRSAMIKSLQLSTRIGKGECDSFIFGSDIEILNLCLSEFKSNTGQTCYLYKYTFEFKYAKDNHCIVTIFPIIHDYMEGVPISEDEAGRDGLGVEYLICLEEMKVIDFIAMRCRSRSFKNEAS